MSTSSDDNLVDNYIMLHAVDDTTFIFREFYFVSRHFNPLLIIIVDCIDHWLLRDLH